jgi:putative ATPase
VEVVREAMQRRNARYDKGGEMHYDTISALIKSVRASDADASLYWLARLIEGGEDPLFIARRLVILASEDVGLADSAALQVAVAAQQAVHFVGMPEGFFPLAHATLYLATAPKSNSVGSSYSAALADVLDTRNDPVPLHLRNAPTRLMRHLRYGEGYHYAHDDYDVEQLNLPPSLADRRYYVPRKEGAERSIAEREAEKRRRPE